MKILTLKCQIQKRFGRMEKLIGEQKRERSHLSLRKYQCGDDSTMELQEKTASWFDILLKTLLKRLEFQRNLWTITCFSYDMERNLTLTLILTKKIK